VFFPSYPITIPYSPLLSPLRKRQTRICVLYARSSAYPDICLTRFTDFPLFSLPTSTSDNPNAVGFYQFFLYTLAPPLFFWFFCSFFQIEGFPSSHRVWSGPSQVPLSVFPSLNETRSLPKELHRLLIDLFCPSARCPSPHSHKQDFLSPASRHLDRSWCGPLRCFRMNSCPLLFRWNLTICI